MNRDTIRRMMLETIAEYGEVFVRELVLERVRLACNDQGMSDRAILDAWDELFRLGVISTGMNVYVVPEHERNHKNHDLYVRIIESHPQSRVGRLPWAHLTDHGKAVVAELSRDPVNSEGYVAHLATVLDPASVAASYVREGLSTFNHACPTATAVLVGAAAESMIIGLRDATATKLATVGYPKEAKALRDADKIKLVIDALAKVYDQKIPTRTPLRERYEASWSTLSHRGRMLRNDAGHPTKLDPVSRDDARTMLILFLTLAELVAELHTFVTNDLA